MDEMTIDQNTGTMTVDFSDFGTLSTYYDSYARVTVKMSYTIPSWETGAQTNEFSIRLVECEKSADTVMSVNLWAEKYYIERGTT